MFPDPIDKTHRDSCNVDDSEIQSEQQKEIDTNEQMVITAKTTPSAAKYEMMKQKLQLQGLVVEKLNGRSRANFF